MPIESFAPGTLIIPMDQTYQDNGMFIAYGLVYDLLSQGIPVKWAIAMGKAYNGIDFTATAQDVQTGASIGTHNYSGGPFIIDSAFAAAALPIINTWIAAHPYPPPTSTVPAIRVHRATAPFSADIAATMTRPPHIAAENANPGQITSYLNAALIPDDAGNPWSVSSPNFYTAKEVGEGALMDNPLDPCCGLDYTVFLSTNTNDPLWKSPSASVTALNEWLAMGGVLAAYSGSLPTFENIGQAGPFLTASGFSTTGSIGDPGLFVNQPAYPVMQTLTPLASGPEGLPAGSVVTWLTSSVTYNARTRVLAYFKHLGLNYDFFIGGSYKNGAGAGKVYYEGGQAYSTAMPYSLNPDGGFVRFIYNVILWSIAKPLIVLSAAPKQVPTAPSTVSFSLDNVGGAEAVNTIVTVTLAPWATYNNDATIPPTSIVGQTLTWNLGTVPYGNILTFTADIDPTAGGFQQVAQYTAAYTDNYFQVYNLSECTSVEVIPGAEPRVSKLPDPQSVHPNDTISWTMTVSNVGVLPLTNVVVTDTLPVGLAFLSAVPAPSSVAGGGLLPTVVTWQTPQIPDPLNPASSFIITLNAKAPPATTATFINEVTVTGKDSIPFSYSFTDTAIVNVTDRPPTVTLIQPNGGEIVCGGINIIWTASDPDGDPLTFSLWYSPNGGMSFIPITSGLTSSPYFWNTSALPSGTNYIVRVIASDGLLTAQDQSNGPFTIDNTPPVVTLIAPPDGSILSNPATVSANATDNIGVNYVDFEYSPNGITYFLISTQTTPVTGNTYSTSWNTGAVPAGSYKLRATAYDDCSSSYDEIDVIIGRPPTVTLIQPNGGEVVCGGINIIWTASDPDGNPLTFTLEYSSNGGISFSLIASGLTASPYFWNTSLLPSGTNYIVRITASDGILTAQDQSNGPFTIDNTPPVVTLIAPPDGSILSNPTTTVSANATDNVGVNYVDFEYSPDGITYTLISTQTTPVTGNTYSTSWNTGAVAAGSYKLRATAYDDCTSSSDEIDVIIDRPPVVTVLFPNGGEVLCPPGSTVTWNAYDPDGNPLTYSVYYSSNGGSSFTLLASGLTTMSYFWNTSSLPSGSNYIVRVVASDGILSAQDQSNGPFTIDNTPPSVNLIAPPNGSILSGTVTVSANATDNIGVVSVDFEYSPDGITYFLISTETTPVVGNTYSTSWDTTVVSGGLYRLRATAYDNCGNSASSQINVRVNQPPEVTLLYPNGGEIICPTGTTITWDAFDPDGDPLTFSLLYSSNGGLTFTLLATGLTAMSYFWNTSSLPSGNNYIIRVIASDGYLTAQDDSDGPFTIDNTPPLVTIISPPTGAYVTGTTTVSATATDNVSVSSVTFEYSLDGISWNLIAVVTTPLGDTYATPWDTTTVADGPYFLRATAADQCGNSSQDLSSVIVDNTPPTVSIDDPPDGSTVFDIVNLLISAQDNECLAKVDVYIDGMLVHTEVEGDTTSTSFIYEWDTNEYPEGPHMVRAVATDCAGLTAETQHTYIVDNLPACYTQVLVDGYLYIPPQKPDAEHIISFDVSWIVKEIKTFNTVYGNKIVVSGFLDIGVTYSATDLEQTEHFAAFSIPFAGMMLCPEIPTDSCLCPVVLVEHEQHHLVNPRTIKKDIVLFIGVRPC